jgi:hypothetical protein
VDEKAVLELRTAMVTFLRVGKRVVAIPALKARVARRLTRLHAAKEGLLARSTRKTTSCKTWL